MLYVLIYLFSRNMSSTETICLPATIKVVVTSLPRTISKNSGMQLCRF